MKVGKIVISFFLLLTYSLGFAYNLVPHYSDFGIDNHHAIQHYHVHASKQDKNPKHEHITHNNHFDEGIYNYIVCLTNETNGASTGATVEHYFTLNTNEIVLKKINALPVTMLLCAVFKIEAQPEIFNSFNDVERIYLPPFIKESPHRGPPII